MKLLIVTHVPHYKEQSRYYAYAPYVREMNLWLKNAPQCTVVAPISTEKKGTIDIPYEHPDIIFFKVPAIALTSFIKILKTMLVLPLVLIRIIKAMQQADHIHLRCPGNMGLLGCILQIGFPFKTKSAKYAGNWDPEAKQPWTYRLQKWILNNTFLTRRMQVLVYGNWKNQSENIRPFFTATYSETEKQAIQKTVHSGETIRLLFAGTLVEGKNPIYAIQLLEQIKESIPNILLDIYGEGKLRRDIEKYVEVSNLKEHVILHGNQSQKIIKKACQQSHFVVLPSKSEGWPKAIAEGMFWGCVPLATAVSCIPDMLAQGKRGVLLQMEVEKDASAINDLINNPSVFEKKSKAAQQWSQKYTLDYFEAEIQKLLQQ
ncbi:glycosyltransferase [Flavobacterium sp. ST-87]|uniref:Glycosyltransferase n=1 Tax=Flavobacterium plantiphilum TaxID=3163297 RepID=A0ABW8XXQ0_9FLAO